MFYKIKAVYKDYLWGGRKLKEEYNAETDSEIVAESWVFSTHKDGLCEIEGSEKNLKNLIGDAPYLVKFLDSKQALSIQVHPNDSMARELEKDNGKNEVWYILECEADAFIYLGLKEEMNKNELASSIEEGTMCDYLNKIKVQKGDFFYVEAGTIHAVGSGITAIEIQQSSNATYRLFDFKRKDKHGNERELHLEKGLQAIDFSKINCTKKEFEVCKTSTYELKKLIHCDYFSVEEYTVFTDTIIDASEYQFASVTIVNGAGVINEIHAKQGDSFVIMMDKLDIKTDNKVVFILTY